MIFRALLPLASMLLAVHLFAADVPPPLAGELSAIYHADQDVRVELESLRRTAPGDRTRIWELQETMADNDEANLARITALLEEHGWIGPALGGPQAAKTVFLVIQHAPLPYQQKYLPLMREAVTQGQLNAGSLALLEDRIALREGRPQTYGSQLRSGPDGKYFVRAMIDPDHVDERRAAVGLPPMATYIKHWDLTWDVETYKREIAAKETLEPEQPRLTRSRKHTDKALRHELRALQESTFTALPRQAQTDPKTMADLNAANLAKFDAFIAKNGWAPAQSVGEDVYDIQLMVVMMADPATKQRYLPILREAAAAKKARPDELAQLEDIVAVNEGRRQIYGTLVSKTPDGKSSVSPVEDPEHLDERRAAAGLPPMAEYLKRWNLTWDAQAFAAAQAQVATK